MSRFKIQLQPTDERVAEFVGPVEAAFAAGRSSRRVSADENHRRVEGTDAVLELDDGVVKASLARLRPVNGRS